MAPSHHLPAYFVYPLGISKKPAYLPQAPCLLLDLALEGFAPR